MKFNIDFLRKETLSRADQNLILRVLVYNFLRPKLFLKHFPSVIAVKIVLTTVFVDISTCSYSPWVLQILHIYKKILQLNCKSFYLSRTDHFSILDFPRVIKQLFEHSGDILAQQYAGSQLVHRIDTYKKLTPAWSTQSRDIVQTLSRYYSNTFSGLFSNRSNSFFKYFYIDTEKQHAMNLFLGVFRPKNGRSHFWELASDYHLHDPRIIPGYLAPQ